MKYLNSLVFLSLMILVAGCQKKEQPAPKKAAHHTSASSSAKAMADKKDAKAMNGKDKKAVHVKKTGPTMLETKKSSAAKKAASAKKDVSKKAMPASKANKKDNIKS